MPHSGDSPFEPFGDGDSPFEPFGDGDSPFEPFGDGDSPFEPFGDGVAFGDASPRCDLSEPYAIR